MEQQLSLRENQIEQLKILKKISEICKELGLKYFLTYGTLLGAIRHKGFIPWDDDIDIMMPRNDYEKLIEYFIKNKEKMSPFEVFYPKNCENYPYYIARISNSNFRIEVENEKDYGIGTFIDVYPLDGMGSDLKNAVKLRRKGKVLSSCCFLATREHFSKGTTSSKLRMILKLPTFIYSKIRGKNYFIDRLDDLSKSFTYEESDLVGCLTWGGHGNERDIMPKEWFGEGKIIPFEEDEFCVPEMYDNILKFFYGDYMQLPPEKDRIPHHLYNVYKK